MKEQTGDGSWTHAEKNVTKPIFVSIYRWNQPGPPSFADLNNATIWPKKEPGIHIAVDAGQIPGGDLLSQDLSSQYHRRCSVSLPGSEWDRVVPLRSGHQRSTPYDRSWVSEDIELC